MQPHWLLLLHVQVAPVPQSVVEPFVQNFVQKWVVSSPRFEHSPAEPLFEQSFKVAQNFPTPSSFPTSPGLPHVDANASTPLVGASITVPGFASIAAFAAASGFCGVELEPHAAASASAMIAILIVRAR